jgi:hypothetical protein
MAPLRTFGRWPTVDEIDQTLSKDAGVRFVKAPPKPRIAAEQREATPGYDERIVHDGVVPTREGNAHDLMNALVWAAFPRAKRALHTKQLDLVRNAIDRGRRTPEHDTIAMLDEGGVLLVNAAVDDDGSAPAATSIVFGHALYQHLAEGAGPVYGLGVPIFLETSLPDLRSADRALAGMLADSERFSSHRWFPRVRVE